MWYSITADFGPGHQSHDFDYFWSDHKLTHDEKQCIFDDRYRDRDWPIGHIRRVRALPKKVIDQKLRRCEQIIAGQQQMLRVLQNTPARTTPSVMSMRKH